MDSERFPVPDGHIAGPEDSSRAVPGGDPSTVPSTVPGGDPSTDPASAPRAVATGDPRVDEAVAGLSALGDRPLEEHPPVLEAVHDTLREILGELGEPGRPGRLGLQGELGHPGDSGDHDGGRG